MVSVALVSFLTFPLPFFRGQNDVLLMLWGIFCPDGAGRGVEFDFVDFLQVKKSDQLLTSDEVLPFYS